MVRVKKHSNCFPLKDANQIVGSSGPDKHNIKHPMNSQAAKPNSSEENGTVHSSRSVLEPVDDILP